MAFRTTFYARHFCSFSTSFKRLEAGTSTTPAAPGGLASGLVGDHAGHLFLVRLVHHAVGIEMAFALGRLRSQDVALKRVSALELARTCLLEALGRSTVCLKLWHSSLSSLQQNRSAGTAYPFTDSLPHCTMREVSACHLWTSASGSRVLSLLPVAQVSCGSPPAPSPAYPAALLFPPA